MKILLTWLNDKPLQLDGKRAIGYGRISFHYLGDSMFEFWEVKTELICKRREQLVSISARWMPTFEKECPAKAALVLMLLAQRLGNG
jgi:hypothetical protein